MSLCRRLYLDLVGYPPSPPRAQQLSGRYASDPNKAWNDCIDRLMANPAFGEKWAKPWLDVSRYADSNGYEKGFAPRPMGVARLGDRGLELRHALRRIHSSADCW